MLIIILTATSSAIEFTLDSPQTAKVNEPFQVTISSSSQETHDVKIIIFDSENEIISEIYNDGWKNPFYYIKSIFPEQTQFEIKPTSYSETAEICARLRVPGKSNFDQSCNLITLEKPSEQQQEELSPPVENEQITSPVTPTADLPDNNLPSPQIENNPPTINNDAIVLNNPQSSEPNEFTSKEQNKRLYIVYAFTIFTIFIIILLALRKL